MLPTTIDAIKSILRADPSMSVAERARLMALLRKGPEKLDTVPVVVPDPRILRRDEVARRLSAYQGDILPRFRLPGGRGRDPGLLRHHAEQDALRGHRDDGGGDRPPARRCSQG